MIRGYVFHKTEAGTPAVAIFSNGEALTVTRPADLRPDVVAHHNHAQALHSGITLLIPTSQLPIGTVGVRLGVMQLDGTMKVSAETTHLTLPCT